MVRTLSVNEDDRPALRSWYALVVLILASLFGFVDRQVLALMTEPIRHDLRLTDTSFGLLQGLGPGLFSAVAAIGVGWLADRMNRAVLLAICVVLWSVATAACGLVNSFLELFLCTLGIGIGEAGLAPIVYSMLPDLFPGRSRIRANLIYFGVGTVGVGAGVWLGGWVGSLVARFSHHLPMMLADMAPWRLTFLTLAAPGPLVAALIAAIGSVGRRSAQTTARSSFLAYYRDHRAAVSGVYAAAALYGFCFYALFAWGPVVIARRYRISANEVGQGLGPVIMVAAAAGVMLAMAISRGLASRPTAWLSMRLFQAFMGATLVPCILLPFAAAPSQAYLLLGLIAAGAYGGASVVPALVQDISPASIRGTALGIWMTTVAVVGNLSPIVIGAVSDRIAAHPTGLVWSFVGVCCPALLLAVLIMRRSEDVVATTSTTIQAEAAAPAAVRLGAPQPGEC
jgi:MFS family permease